MISDLLDHQRNSDKSHAGVHELFLRARFSAENLASYGDDGSVPPRILKSMIPTADPNDSRNKETSSYVRDNREDEVPIDENEDALLEPTAESQGAYVLDNSAVMPTGQDQAVSQESRPERLRSLRRNLVNLQSGAVSTPRSGEIIVTDQEAVTAEEAAEVVSAAAALLRNETDDSSLENGPSLQERRAAADFAASTAVSATASLTARAAAVRAAASGRPPPEPTKNMLVVPHTGRLVEDFNEPGVMIAAYFDLFPHGVGGHLDNRPRKISFERWARILVRRRDSRFRKSRTFVFCMAAIIFRREAIKNAHWKLKGRVSRGVAGLLGSITPDDILAVAREMELGSSAGKALATRPATKQLIASMQSVNGNSSWAMFNKKTLRMIAISMIFQLGQPLYWMTLNPAGTNSPIVMKLAGVDLDVSSRLKADMPNYPERLRVISADPVASADFFHITIQAVLETLLRFGASDGDGGVLGRVKAYVGMTEEQRRLMLHCHLLVWVYGFNEFASLRDVMDKTPGSYQEVATILSRTILSQITSYEDLQHVMQGEPEPTGDLRTAPPEQSALERPAKECVVMPPPPSCFPRPGADRDVRSEESYLRKFHSDVANITKTANTHECTFTCRKYGHIDSCRYVCDGFVSYFFIGLNRVIPLGRGQLSFLWSPLYVTKEGFWQVSYVPATGIAHHARKHRPPFLCLSCSALLGVFNEIIQHNTARQ